MYSIKDLERISGIKAHTIRMWEKRFELLDPQRTGGNHRLYSDDDLIKLLRVEHLISSGNKISNIASFSGEQLRDEVQLLFSEETDQHSDVAFYNFKWLQSALNYDEQEFDRIYSDLRSRLTFVELWESYLVPGLQHMGKLWMTEELAPAEEHFFSHLVQRKILAEFDQLSIPDITGESCLLFLPPGEYHELGLLVTDYILRMHGISTINLGPDLPLENLKKVISDQNIKTMISFIQGMKINPEFLEFIINFRGNGREIVLNGRINDEDSKKVYSNPNIHLIASIDAFETFITGNEHLKS